jgi:hypothetical protein
MFANYDFRKTRIPASLAGIYGSLTLPTSNLLLTQAFCKQIPYVCTTTKQGYSRSMYDQTQGSPIRAQSPEALLGLNGPAENGPDTTPLPEEIQFEQAYSTGILQYLQSTGEGIIGVHNARGRLMKDMGLPHEEKGTRIHVTRSLEELERYNLIQVLGNRNRSPTRIKSIIPTKFGLTYQLPPEEEPEK